MSWNGVANSGEFLYSTADNDLINYGELDGDVKGGIFQTVVSGIAGIPIEDGVPAVDQILKYDGSQWAFAPDASGQDVAAHNLLSSVHSDTSSNDPVRGDLIVGSGAGPAWNRLPLGTAEFVLHSDGTDALWTRLGQATPFEDGTVSLPSVTYDSDGTTGSYLPASGSLGLVANGDELITLDGINTHITFDGGQRHETRAVGANDTLTDADYIIMVTAASVDISLPASPTEGQTVIIKDRDGNAGGALANRILIDGNGNNIDGDAFIRIRNNYGSFTLVYSGSEWNVI